MAEPVFACASDALATLDEHSLPSSDGKPMAENTRHARIIIHSANLVGERFADRADVLVAADLLLYYPGDPGKPHIPGRDEKPPIESVAPDLFVVFGVSSRDRKSYVLWQEHKVPAFALEVASESSGERDQAKKSIYESLGVTEHFVFDPDSGLQGFRLEDGRYRPIQWTDMELGRDGLHSQTLGLFLFPHGPENELEWYDPATGDILRNYRQAERGRRMAEEEVARVRARNVELLALVRKLQTDSE